MPTTVNNIFNRFNLTIDGQVKWNTEIKSSDYGVYVVALTDDPDNLITTSKPNFDEVAINGWIQLIKTKGKTLMIDGLPATVDLIQKRLTQFWLPDETVYIGKAGPTKNRTLRKRINEYYQTTLGCDKCHGGGHWLNTLKDIFELNIFYSETNPLIEKEMIIYFGEQVSEISKANLYDKKNSFPFANKELDKGSRKIHGLSNQTIDCGSNWKK